MRKAYDSSVSVKVKRTSPSKTLQSFKDQMDINKIVAKSRKNGVLPDMIRADARYGDFAAAPDYFTAQLLITKANEQFMALDAHVRERFRNDPYLFLQFAADAKNQDEMVRMGLAVKKPEPPRESPKDDASSLKPSPPPQGVAAKAPDA